MINNALEKPRMGFGISIRDLDDLERVAVLAAKSGFFNNAREVAQGCMIMQYGAELGLSPIASLQNINVIENKLAISGSMIAALIKGSKRYDFKPLEVTPTKARVLFLQDGAEQGIVTYSWADAERANLTRKFNWRSYPEDMLWWRCLSRGARRHCPDVFLGKVYTPEELSDGDHLPDGDQSSYLETDTSSTSSWTRTPDNAEIIEDSGSVDSKGNGERKKENLTDVEEKGIVLGDVSQVLLSNGIERKKENKETKNEQPRNSKERSSTSVMLQWMSAVDSCETIEDFDDTHDSWEGILKELPRGVEHCMAYWRVAVAKLGKDDVPADDVEMANKLNQVRK